MIGYHGRGKQAAEGQAEGGSSHWESGGLHGNGFSGSIVTRPCLEIRGWPFAITRDRWAPISSSGCLRAAEHGPFMPLVIDPAHQQGTVKAGRSSREEILVVKEARLYFLHGERLHLPVPGMQLEAMIPAWFFCIGESQRPALKEIRCLLQGTEYRRPGQVRCDVSLHGQPGLTREFTHQSLEPALSVNKEMLGSW